MRTEKNKLVYHILLISFALFAGLGLIYAVYATTIGNDISTANFTGSGTATATNLVVVTGLTLPNNSVTDAMTSDTLTCSILAAVSSVVADAEVDDNLTISGGTVNNTPIGASTASSGVFTTLSAATTTIGGGTGIVKHISITTTTVVSASVAATSCVDYATINTVTGAAAGDTVIASPSPATNGIEDFSLSWNAYVSTDNTVVIRACNPTNAAIDAGDTQTWRIDVWQH